MKDELADYGLAALHLVDESGVEDYAIELKRVIGYVGSDGAIRIGTRTEPTAWAAVATGFRATCPNRTDIHHIVTIPKRGNGPPLTASQLMAHSNGLGVKRWSIVEDGARAWRYESTRAVNGKVDLAAIHRRDSARIASLFKSAGRDIDTSIVEKQIIATWISPLERTPDNTYRVSVKYWTGVPDRAVRNMSAICARIHAKRDEKASVATDTEQATIVGDLEPFRRVAMGQCLRPMVLGLGIIPVSGTLGALQFGDYLCTEAAAYGSTKKQAEALLDLFGNAMWNLAHSPSTPLRSATRGFERLGIWSMVLPQPKRSSRNGEPRRNGHAEEETVLAGQQWFSIRPGRQVKRMDDLVSDGLAEIMVERYQLHDAGLLGVPFRTSLKLDGTFHGGCVFALLSAPGLTKSQLDDVGHRVSNLLLRQALNWPTAVSAPATGSVATPKEPNKKKRTQYAEIRIQMAKDHDKIWTALERVAAEPPELRVKKLLKELPDWPAYAKKYPNLLKLKSDLEANASLTALVESAWKLMGGGSIRNLYRWREQAGLTSRRQS